MAVRHPVPSIHGVGTVFVPVTDQARALAFYTQTLGFEKRMDIEYGGGQRWVEVAPPGAAQRIALVPGSEGSAGIGTNTYCALEVDDAEATHAMLASRGAEVSAIGRQGTGRTGLFGDDVLIKDPVPPQFYLRDPDGNRFLIVQVIR